MSAKLDDQFHLPLTLVCAPAGFGKTTLIRQWSESCEGPVAWLQLDPEDKAPKRLLGHLVAAVRRVVPNACAEVGELLGANRSRPLRDLGRALAADLGLLEGRLVLVLDDYSSVPGAAIHTLLEEVLKDPPAPLHLVILSRREPPLPIHTFRVRGHVCEIRQRDLMFSTEETSALFDQCLGRSLDGGTIDMIRKRYEGWPAGLHLQALSLRDRAAKELTPADLLETASQVEAYLRAEVFDRQPGDIQHYLLRCSILERLTASLCEAVAGAPPDGLAGSAFLEHVMRESLFVVRLDGDPPWYRLRQPFGDFLRARLHAKLSQARVRELHARAREWLEARGHIVEAVEHALSGGDPPCAARILAEHRIEMLNDGRLAELSQLASRLPDEVRESHLDLQLLKVWTMPAELMPEAAAGVDAALAQAAPSEEVAEAAHAELRLAQAGARISTNLVEPFDVARLIEDSAHAIAHIPRHFREARAIARLFQAQARQMSGDLAGALDVIREGLLEHLTAGGHPCTAIHAAECLVHHAEANLSVVRDAARRCLAVPLPPGAGLSWKELARRLLASVHYQWNELELARQVVQDPEIPSTATSLAILAHILQAGGRESEVDAVVRQVVEQATAPGAETELFLAGALEAEIALRRGHLEAALRWAEGAATEQIRPVSSAVHLTAIRARIFLAEGSDGHLRRAKELIELLRRFGETTHNRNTLIGALALEALLRAAQGEEGEALTTLQRSLELAQPRGFVRLFADLGEKARELLAHVAVPREAESYVDRVRAAFEPARGAPAVTQPLPDPLTNRELEILEFLAQRYSNKDIAKRLFISVETVKRHNTNVFQKLHVHRRSEAVAKALALGILTGS